MGYWLYAGHLLTIYGLALSNALFGLAGVWTVVRRDRLVRPLWDPVIRRTDRILLPLAAYALFLVVSVFGSYDPGESVNNLRDLLTLATLPLALVLVRGRWEVRRLFDLLILVTALHALFGIGQYLFGDYGGLQGRIPGPFSHYMTYSGVLLVGVCLLLGRMMIGEEWRRASNWIVLLLAMVAMVLTLTRNAWLAALLVVTVALTVRARRWLIAWVAGLALMAVLAAALAPQGWARFKSIADPADPSNYDRLCMVYAGWHMIVERPLYGIGPGMVKNLYPIYRHPTAPRLQVIHLHNTYVHMAAEQGLLSLFAYLWLCWACGLEAWRKYRRDGGLAGPRADLLLGVLLALLGIAVAGLFEANWRDTEIQRWMLFLLAVPFCLGPGVEKGRTRGDEA